MTSSEHTPIPLAQFVSAAGRFGPVAGVLTAPRLSWVPDDLTVRSVDADRMTTVAALFDEFARAWSFPDHFGHNRDAFDECMRHLDPTPPDVRAPSAYLTVIENAPRLLSHEPDDLRWFAGSLEFYRDHYRDVADPTAAFAVALLSPPTRRRRVETRWHDAGSPVALIES
ncbi:barstar family protein [Gordonia hankookensis]|uniref:Barstar family protein n=1 Tax=Gordonia hankookensis TaxID=589403 RepID=A0ABR7WDD2_9ACTN|nr:barstar family protein [Gordonia hankookensis]MBD1319862.1 barstar family protein [Gordonia hankookensis]